MRYAQSAKEESAKVINSGSRPEATLIAEGWISPRQREVPTFLDLGFSVLWILTARIGRTLGRHSEGLGGLEVDVRALIEVRDLRGGKSAGSKRGNEMQGVMEWRGWREWKEWSGGNGRGVEGVEGMKGVEGGHGVEGWDEAEGWTDGWTERWGIETGASPLASNSMRAASTASFHHFGTEQHEPGLWSLEVFQCAEIRGSTHTFAPESARLLGCGPR